ncbi:MAG: DUF5947 family protein [Streptosporangiaceae bacterium]|jgi:Fe-S cluster biogenesis protein NfuA
MAPGHDAQVVGEKLEKLLAELRSNAGPELAQTAAELVSCLVGLYGDGLAEIVKVIGEDAEAGPRLMHRLIADPLVESLLLVHDLHPLEVGARVQRAIDQVLAQFGSHAGRVEFGGIDDQGVIHLRLETAAGHGCGSSPDAVRLAVAEAVTAAAPETAGLDLEMVQAPADLPLLQIGRRPAGPANPAPTAPKAAAAPPPHPQDLGDQRTLDGLAALVAGLPALESGPGLNGTRSTDAGPAQAGVEHCELCREVLQDRHGHLVDTEKRSLACACRACYLLFTHEGAAGGRYRAVPERVYHDPDHPLSAEDWNELQIPVALAFFFRNSAIGRVVAGYPSPAGPTECELDLQAWDRIAAAHPLFATMSPDVEAILVNRTDLGHEVFLIPIDMCYSLVGELRMYWTGFDGGAEVRTAVAAFLAGLRHRAVALDRRAAYSELGH